MRAIADASLIDGPVRTVVLVFGGFALAWLLCRAAAAADRVEPGCDEPPWLDCQGRHGYARQPGGAWRCLICDEPQLYTSTEVYDHLAVEALHADLDAWNRRAS